MSKIIDAKIYFHLCQLEMYDQEIVVEGYDVPVKVLQVQSFSSLLKNKKYNTNSLL